MLTVSLKTYKNKTPILTIFTLLGTWKLSNHSDLHYGTAVGKLREAGVSKHAPALPLTLLRGEREC